LEKFQRFKPREALHTFTLRFLDSENAEIFSGFAEMRNIITHEYSDIKREKIKRFIDDSSRLYPIFIENPKGLIKS